MRPRRTLDIKRSDTAIRSCRATGLSLFPISVRGDLIRIISDVHYGDRASRVLRLKQLDPLLGEVSRVVFNGDTLDTRPGPHAAYTAVCRQDVLAFAAGSGVPLTFLTGNHDPDVSTQHSLDLGGGEVFVVHGDVLFEDIVPWGRDALEIRSRLAKALAGNGHPDPRQIPLDERFLIWRAVARSVPQRHQGERRRLRYAVRFLADTVWPPTRFLKIFDAWRREPVLAADLAREHRPNARFVILGHTHRPSIRPMADGRIIINTGSFTAPFGGFAVDLTTDTLRVRRIEYRGHEFRPGKVVAEFPLAKR